MLALSLAEVAKAVGGQLVFGDPEFKVSAVSTDTRTLPPDALFVALVGERYDGHQFVRDAVRRGAIGAVVSRDDAVNALLKINGLMAERAGAPMDPVIIRVSDTLGALQSLAREVRRRCPVPLIAVTGSNGKTTVKEMIASVLSTGYNVHKTEGNLNNHVGVPLTLLDLTHEHEVAVLEMGMNALGEIRKLCSIARPTVGVVTNVAPAHLEFLGSLDNVVRAKRELVEWLREMAPVVLNADDPRSADIARGLSRRYIWHGVETDVYVRGEDVSVTRSGTVDFTLRIGAETRPVSLALPGGYNVSNALAAAAAGSALGLGLEEICRGLESYRGLSMRMELIELNGGVRVVNDAYNANPASMVAALRSFAQMAAGEASHAVLGDMLELGSDEEALHREVGELVASLPLGRLYTVGDRAAVLADSAVHAGMSEERVHVCRTHDEAAETLRRSLGERDWVMVKGSRGMHMEQVVKALREKRHL